MSSSKSAGGQKSAAISRGTVIRIAVWGTLGVLVILTLLDMKSRVAAQQTRDAWLAAQKEKVSGHRDLHQSELQGFIQGSPKLPPIEEEADRHRDICRKVLRYTWPGIVRDYTVSVYLGLGEDASVEYVEGPGKVVSDDDDSGGVADTGFDSADPPAADVDSPAGSAEGAATNPAAERLPATVGAAPPAEQPDDAAAAP